jgi:hypothetical protein
VLLHPRWPKGRQVLDPRTLNSQSLSQVKITVLGSQGSSSKTRFTTHPARNCKKLQCNFGWTCATMRIWCFRGTAPWYMRGMMRAVSSAA